MKVARYHSSLRVSLVVVALALVFDGGFLIPLSKELSDNTIDYLANSVGIYAQVSPNEINEITAELSARERALEEREIAAREFNTKEENDYSVYILSTILFILTVLIILNYAMDWIRVRSLAHEG